MDTRGYPGGDRGGGRRGRRRRCARYAGTGVAADRSSTSPASAPRDGNTDKVRVTIDRARRDVIGRSDLPPFQAGINAGAPAVMLSPRVYPTLDRGHHRLPVARRSSPACSRSGWASTGVAMTDSLEAYSVRSRMSMEKAAVRCMRAGIDLVLTTGQGTHLRALRALTAEARRDPAFRARLQDAANASPR